MYKNNYFKVVWPINIKPLHPTKPKTWFCAERLGVVRIVNKIMLIVSFFVMIFRFFDLWLFELLFLLWCYFWCFLWLICYLLLTLIKCLLSKTPSNSPFPYGLPLVEGGGFHRTGRCSGLCLGVYFVWRFWLFVFLSWFINF